MAEALIYQSDDCVLDYTPVVAASAGEVRQLSNGQACFVPTDLAASQKGAAVVEGIALIAKTTSMVFLDGGRVYWDASANAAHYKKVNDADFYVGRAFGDAASAATTMYVQLNVDPPYDIDMLRDGALSIPTGTQAAGTTGFGLPQIYGNARAFLLSATSEAQCIDYLSVDRFAVAANPIAEFILRIAVNGSTSAVDLSVGLANATSTTDADAIAESVFFHMDGGDLSIFCESDDGTTEVAATDSTIDATAGSAVANRVELWIDGRDPSDMKYYINGAEVLNATANLGNISVAAGPLGLLFHLEKTTGTATAGPIYLDAARCRLMSQ